MDDANRQLDPQEINDRLELIELLIREVRQLGKHGNTLSKRQACLYVEEHLTAWKVENATTPASLQ